MGIKDKFRNYSLKRSALGYAQKPYPGFGAIKHIGIVWELGTGDEAIMAYAQKLKNLGKEVKLLVYIPQKTKEISQTYPFPWFCKSDVNWFGKPKAVAVENFVNGSYDILIDFTSHESHPMDFVMYATAADFTIGAFVRRHLNYSLSIVLKNRKIDNAVFKEIDYYLNFINKA